MHNDEKIIKITRCVRGIENKKKLINLRMINEYVKNKFNPKDITEKDLRIEQIKTKINTSFNTKELYPKENYLEIVSEHERFIDTLLSYDHRAKNTRNIRVKSLIMVGRYKNLIIVGIVIIATIWISKTFITSQISKERDSKTSSQSSKKSHYTQYGDVHGAWAYMQIYVERRLKSPKSADFPFGGGTYHTKDLGNGRYEVNSYVDSKNAFGATMRTYFKGVIKRKDGGWVLEYLNFGN